MIDRDSVIQHLDLICLISQIPTSLIDIEGNTLFCPIVEEHHYWPTNAAKTIINSYLEKDLPNHIPYIHVFNQYFLQGVIRLSETLFIFVGPSALTQTTLENVISSFSDIVPNDELLHFYSIYGYGTTIDYFRFAALLAEISNYNTGTRLSGPEIINQNFKTNMELTPDPPSSIASKAPNSLEAILMFQHALFLDIREGNIDALEKQWHTPAANNFRISEYTTDDMFFFFAPFYTFMFQGALHGGANPQLCYDKYMTQIKRFKLIKNTAEAMAEIERSAIEYCQLVIDCKNSTIMPEVCQTCISYINDHINEKINIDDLAHLCGLYKNKLYEIFRSQFNMTIGDYIEQERLRRSIVYLESSHYSLAEIANTMGFASQSHFTQIFKKHFGCTPGQYKKNGFSSLIDSDKQTSL